MNNYYIGLTGAKKNIGDFLISQRSLALLNLLRPDREIIVQPHWESLENKLKLINDSKAIIIFGGPGFQKNMYPGVYKLTENLDKIQVPIIPLGLGWKGFPGDFTSYKQYSFSKSSRKLLDKIASTTPLIGCRDYTTKDLLNNLGISNAVMTGCPVWYDLDSIGKQIIPPSKIANIVFTPAQKSIYRDQCIKLMLTIKQFFPDSLLHCSFHRGIHSIDQFTPETDSANNSIIEKEALKIGYKIIDASSNLNNIAFYDACDLHIGYRVHGHLYFLSKRKPSFLLHEDGRGTALSYSLNLSGVDAFKRTFYGHATASWKSSILTRIFNRLFKSVTSDNDAITKLENCLRDETQNGFLRFSGVHNIIDSHFEIMKHFIKQLP